VSLLIFGCERASKRYSGLLALIGRGWWTSESEWLVAVAISSILVYKYGKSRSSATAAAAALHSEEVACWVDGLLIACDSMKIRTVYGKSVVPLLLTLRDACLRPNWRIRTFYDALTMTIFSIRPYDMFGNILWNRWASDIKRDALRADYTGGFDAFSDET
jgi:hypothetical protein